MKVLITGASGLLGRAVHRRCLDLDHDVKALALTRSDPEKQLHKLDLTDADALRACINDFKPDVIIHTAAERRADVVERDPHASNAINVDVPASLATLAAQALRSNATPPLLINISTDYVFDGSKPPYSVDDSPNPLNAYGVSKLQGERALAQHAKPSHFTNVRVPVLYGRAIPNSESAVNVLLDAIRPRPDASTIKCDAYAVRYPTSVDDVARALLRIADTFFQQPSDAKNIPPTLHFSAKEAMTKYDMCLVLSRIANAVGLETQTHHLDPEYDVDPLAATARPRHCKLDTSVLEQLGVPIDYTPFEEWWRPYLTELQQAEAEERRRKQEEEERQRKLQEEKAEQERLRKAKEEEERQREMKEEKEEAQRKALADEEERQRKAEEEEKEKVEDERRRQAEVVEQEVQPEGEDAHSEPKPKGEAEDAEQEQDDEKLEDVVAASDVVASKSPTSTSVTVTDGPQSASGSKDASPPVEPPTDEAPAPPTPVDSPLNLSAAAVDDRLRRGNGGGVLAERSLSGSSAGGPSRLASLTDEKNLFGGGVRALDVQGAAGGAAARGRAEDANGDNDSDGYGQPSPRTDHAVVPGSAVGAAAGGAAQTVAGGFGVDSTTSFHSDASTSAAVRGSTEGLSAQPPQPHAAQQQQPLQQEAAAPPPQPYHRSSFDAAQQERERLAHERATRKRWDFSIRVGDPQKVGDPMTAHIVYTVRTTTECPRFRARQFSALRRYKDFRWLHAALVQNNPGIIVPPVPEKVTIGRFAAELVEARRLGLETCINKIASHALLQEDDDLRLFLESDNFAADVRARDAVKGAVVTPEQKTRKSWVPGVSAIQSISSSGTMHKFHEFDEWFERQKVYLDSLEGCLKQMVKSISYVSAQRKELAASIAEVGNVLMTLSGSSLSRSLSTCFAGLAEVQKKAFEVEEALAEADVRQVGTVMYEYERTVGSVRKAFATRLDVWQTWQRNNDDVARAKTRYNKLKNTSARNGGGSVSSHHLSSLLSEVSEAEVGSLEKEREFHLVSSRCKSEMERLDQERVDDFIKAVEAWLDGMVQRQEEMVQEWENYLALVGRQMGLNAAPTSVVTSE